MAEKKSMSRQRRWQIAQKAKGCCPVCGKASEPGFDSGLCERHRGINRERQFERKTRFLHTPDDGEDD